MYKYKLKNSDEQTIREAEGTIIPGVGVVINGIVNSEVKFENPNFVLVDEQNQQPVPAPAHVAGVAPQNVQPQPVVQLNEEAVNTAGNDGAN